MSSADHCELLEIGTGAEEMSNQERAGARSDQTLEEVGARRQRVGIDVDWQRAQSASLDDTDHVWMGDRRNRDFVARLERESFEGETEGRTDRQAGEPGFTARPRLQHSLLRSLLTRSTARAQREEEVAERDVREEPRSKTPTRGVPLLHEPGLERRDRIPQSLGGFAGSQPWVGREVLERHGLSKLHCHRRKAVSRSVPTTAAGTSGMPAARATRAAPE